MAVILQLENRWIQSHRNSEIQMIEASSQKRSNLNSPKLSATTQKWDTHPYRNVGQRPETTPLKMTAETTYRVASRIFIKLIIVKR